MKDCYYCQNQNFIIENELAGAFYDQTPISKGHMLIIPKRHTPDYFQLTMEEKKNIDELIMKSKALLDEQYSPTGYNIGTNCGTDAGQSTMHSHIHLIPRYKGDTPNPKGGIRKILSS
ncbi:HIT family protein [Aerococcus urinaeequi]|uniref:HIT family protein n=1 Tax=Aerococcus urinaeequi TaxID=51665 RepID=UPI003D6C4C71